MMLYRESKSDRASVLEAYRASKIAVSVALACSAPTQAATINVDAGCTLRDAIVSANTDAAVAACEAGSGPDTIAVPEGTIEYTSYLPGTYVLGYAALPHIVSSITLQGSQGGEGVSPTRIRRSYSAGIPDFRLITILEGGQLTVRSIRLNNGQALSGGGILCVEGELTMQESSVSSNSSVLSGGGIAASQCTVTLENATFSDNMAGQRGGGIYSTLSHVTLEDSSFYANYATSDAGGAIAMQGSILYANNLNIRYNEATSGGAVAIYQSFQFNIRNSILNSNTASATGGAVFASNGVANLTSNTIDNNYAGLSGGAVHAFGLSLNLNDNSVSGNSTGGQGGGLNINDANVQLSNNRFQANTAFAAGAAFITNSTASITGNTIAGNQGSTSAAAVFIGNQDFATHISNNTFNNNTSTGDNGALTVVASTNVQGQLNRFTGNSAQRAAALAVSTGSSMTLSQTTVDGNVATVGSAGGVSVDASYLRLNDSTISNNVADTGAGMSIRNSGTVQLVNSTVSSNTASFFAGGIVTSNSSLSLTHSAVVFNEGLNYASGLYMGGVSSSVFLVNSIVANNDNADCNRLADTVFAGNWFGDASCSDNADGDPMLSPLANNGGPTRTHALNAGSGAINIALDGFCLNPVNNRDQRGFERTDKCDSGPFEFGASDTTFFVIPLANGGSVVVPL